MNFDEAFERLIDIEKGYSNDPNDPGGETNLGISRSAYPHEDIAGMTLERAKALYLRDYWGPAGCDAVPPAIKFLLFDLAVNSGVKTAIRLLQRAVEARVDGDLGPRTLAAVNSMPAPRLVARLCGLRLALMASLPTWQRFGRGWTLRVVDCLLEA